MAALLLSRASALLYRVSALVNGQGAFCDQVDYQPRPPGLVGGSQAGSVIAVEVLVEPYEIPPGGVLLEQFVVSMGGPVTIGAR